MTLAIAINMSSYKAQSNRHKLYVYGTYYDTNHRKSHKWTYLHMSVMWMQILIFMIFGGFGVANGALGKRD